MGDQLVDGMGDLLFKAMWMGRLSNKQWESAPAKWGQSKLAMELHLNSVGFEFWPEAIGVALPSPPPLGRLWTLCPAKSEPWPSHFTHNLYRINVARMVHVGISINPTIGGVSRGSARVCCRDCEHPVSANSISGDSNTADVLPLTLPATAQDLQLVGGFNPCQQCRSQLESSSRVGRMEFMYVYI